MIALTVITRSTNAQTVVGTLRRADNDVPAEGVLVLAERVNDASVVARAISDARGRFRLAVTEAHIVLRALRVGYQPVLLDTVRLAAGQRHELNAVLTMEPFALQPARAVGATRCPALPKGEAILVGQLVQQARTTLHMADVAVGQGSLTTSAEVVRRSGDQILDRRVVETRGAGAFRGHSVDSLMRDGFVSQLRNGRLHYRAPDVAAFLDDAFVAEYCLSLVRDSIRHPYAFGVRFVPERLRGGRTDVQATLWLDSARASLRHLDFLYVGADPLIERASGGGQLAFTELDNGVSFVHDWELRMPVIGEATVMRRMGSRATRVRELTEVITARGRVLSIGLADAPRYLWVDALTTAADRSTRSRVDSVGTSSGACVGSAVRSLSGVVLSAAPDGRSVIPFAEISLQWRSSSHPKGPLAVNTTQADLEGRFWLCGNANADLLRLQVAAPEHESASVLLRLSSGAGGALVPIVLRRR